MQPLSGRGSPCDARGEHQGARPIDPTDIAEAAALLVAARRTRARIDLLPESCRPRSVADAHAIQDAVTAALGTAVGAFKANASAPTVGATDTAWSIAAGVRAPIYASTIGVSPARIPAVEAPQCGVEGEVAFRFRGDLPPRAAPYSREEVAACAAIEVVTSRYADPDTATFLDKLADCVSIGGHPTGDPLGIAVALVEMMRGVGGVKAGQFVTCGSCTGLRYLEPGDSCRVHFDGVGGAEVTFTS